MQVQSAVPDGCGGGARITSAPLRPPTGQDGCGCWLVEHTASVRGAPRLAIAAQQRAVRVWRRFGRGGLRVHLIVPEDPRIRNIDRRSLGDCVPIER